MRLEALDMENTATLDVSPQADAEYEAAVDSLIAQMKQTREQMADDQREIERLRAETSVILAQLKAA